MGATTCTFLLFFLFLFLICVAKGSRRVRCVGDKVIAPPVLQRSVGSAWGEWGVLWLYLLLFLVQRCRRSNECTTTTAALKLANQLGWSIPVFVHRCFYLKTGPCSLLRVSHVRLFLCVEKNGSVFAFALCVAGQLHRSFDINVLSFFPPFPLFSLA